MKPRRLHLAHLPTPLVRPRALAQELGIDLWVKRDDATGGAEAGNKIRKLEFLLADAIAKKSDLVVTCGGLQSNHARATALAAASLGLGSLLFLRTKSEDLDPSRAPFEGNVLLDRLAGADIRLITEAAYRERNPLMEMARQRLLGEGRRPYVIPEGGSNGLGALGYVAAMAEVKKQLTLGLAGGRPFDAIVHACGSGGTAAGVAMGAALHGVAKRVIPIAVCDDAATFDARIRDIVNEAVALDASLPGTSDIVCATDDRFRGPAYAVASPEQRASIAYAASKAGLVFDPVYTGKVFFALQALAKEELRGARVLFLHTGGLPGLLAQGSDFANA